MGEQETAVDYVATVRRESAALADAADGHWARPVPGCPGWTVTDLLWHLREVQWSWGRIVDEGLAEPPDDARTPPRPDDPAELLADVRAGAQRLADILAAADPAQPCWTWASQQDAAFVIRHQAQEAAVHRWDAESALPGASPAPIDAAVAADALSEWLEFSAGWARREVTPLPGPVLLHATDTGSTWTLVEGDRHTLRVIDPVPARPPVATVSGTASDLLLAVYRRIGSDRLLISGDPRSWELVAGVGVE